MAVKDEVLKALENNKGTYISGEELSRTLGVSRAAVWKAIKALREAGYLIEAVTNRGYMMPKSENEITDVALKLALPANLRNNKILVYDSVDSTNKLARQLILEGKLGNGSAIVSNQQTAGRGRLGRSFFSPKNGIYISIIIKPDFEMSKSTLVTVATAVAVAEAIDSVLNDDSEETKIKWVNDIYLKNKKVCGILTEANMDFETGTIDSLIIGIGINTDVSAFPKDLENIAGAVEGEYSRAELTAKVIEKTLKYVGEVGDEHPKFIENYRNKSLLTCKKIKVYKGSYKANPEDELGGIDANVLGIDDTGGLQVVYSNGEKETLTTGEISVRLD